MQTLKIFLFQAHGGENIKKLQYCARNGFISKNIYYKLISFSFNLWKITHLLVLTCFIETDEPSTMNGLHRLKEYMANYILWGFSKVTKHIVIHFYRLLFIFWKFSLYNFSLYKFTLWNSFRLIFFSFSIERVSYYNYGK